jgi:hypothetical protein
MTVSEIATAVQFVIGKQGEPTAALIDIATWRAIVSMLEEAEDQGLLRSYLTRRSKASSPKEMGLIPWEEAEAALDAGESVHDAAVD